VLIGEFLYDLRCCLDYLTCELTTLNRRTPTERTEFPIFNDRLKFGTATDTDRGAAFTKKIGGLSSVHQALIENEQPYYGRYGRPEDDPLWWLHQLSNTDKHRFLHLVITVARQAAIKLEPPAAAQRFNMISLNLGTLKDGAELARFAFLPGPGLQVDVNSNVEFDVAFDEKGPGAGKPVKQTLAQIGIRVTKIIQLFGPFDQPPWQ
jgi:hypothetical protein